MVKQIVSPTEIKTTKLGKIGEKLHLRGWIYLKSWKQYEKIAQIYAQRGKNPRNNSGNRPKLKSAGLVTPQLLLCLINSMSLAIQYNIYILTTYISRL